MASMWDLPVKYVYVISGCELIDTENISMPSQNMKFVVE
jgi:hypothetical protein